MGRTTQAMAYQHIRDNGLLSEMRFRVFEEIVFAHEKGETLSCRGRRPPGQGQPRRVSTSS
jgi:hypothetical protein